VSDLTVWRLASKRRASTLWDGEGAFRRGARWSPPGVRAVYCAESRALAALEVLVHVEEVSDFVAHDWVIASASIPESLIEHPSKLPGDWRVYPYGHATQTFGAEWIRSGRSVALRVPSAVVLGEFNYLLNPQHPDFSKVSTGKPGPFQFDPRLP
jgi:RES domain-containing protein